MAPVAAGAAAAGAPVACGGVVWAEAANDATARASGIAIHMAIGNGRVMSGIRNPEWLNELAGGTGPVCVATPPTRIQTSIAAASARSHPRGRPPVCRRCAMQETGEACRRETPTGSGVVAPVRAGRRLRCRRSPVSSRGPSAWAVRGRVARRRSKRPERSATARRRRPHRKPAAPQAAPDPIPPVRPTTGPRHPPPVTMTSGGCGCVLR